MLTRFSNASHPGSHNENQLTLLNARTELKTDLRFWHDRELVQMYTNIYFGEPDRFSHKTQIRFSEFSESFIGSSSSCATFLPLLLLFFSYCYYSSPIIILLAFLLLLFFLLFFLILLLLFSHYYFSLFITITHCFTPISVLYYYCYYFPIALILFLLPLLFSHGVALFVWWSHLII
jgi:hypothetical protein